VNAESGNSKRVLIAGYYGYENSGDEAILSGLLTELRSTGENLRFFVLSNNPIRTTAIHGVESVAWSDFLGMIEVMQKSSLVIVGAGGLFQDYWGADVASFLTRQQGGISQFGAPILLAKLLGIPSMIYAVGVGPLETDEGRRLTRILFETVDAATVRDEESRELLANLGVSVTGLQLARDPAFSARETPIPTELKQQIRNLPNPLIGVSVRYWDLDAKPDDWQARVSKALDQVLSELGGTVR